MTHVSPASASMGGLGGGSMDAAKGKDGDNIPTPPCHTVCVMRYSALCQTYHSP